MHPVAKTAMSMEVHQNHVLKGGVKIGRTRISIPEKQSPAPNHREKLISQTTRQRNHQITRFQKLRNLLF